MSLSALEIKGNPCHCLHWKSKETYVTVCIGNQRKPMSLSALEIKGNTTDCIFLERRQLVFGREYKHYVGVIQG